MVEPKSQLAQQIADVEDEIAEVRLNDPNAKEPQEALKNFNAVFGVLQPHEKQELLALVVGEIE